MIDEIDEKIVKLLQENARIANADIARQLDMAPSAIFERIRKLEARGVIKGYEARIDPGAVGRGLVAFVFVRSEEKIAGLETGAHLARFPEVQEVHLIAGEDCYLVKVRVASTEALGRLLSERFRTIPGVRSTRTTIVLTTLKETGTIAIASAQEEFTDAAGA